MKKPNKEHFENKYIHIDPEKYRKILSKPLWYLQFIQFPEVQESFYDKNEDLPLIRTWREEKQKRRREMRKEIYSIVLEAFAERKIAFGTSGKDWDRERGLVDTIVIHCHESEHFTHKNMASVIPLVRLYIPTYANASKDSEKYHKPIWSNHFDEEGKMNFWTYHWIIKDDGSVYRQLQDNQVGWHAGNWEYNCKSAAICLPSNFTQEEPSEEILNSAAKIIKTYYPHVPIENIIGHREVSRDPKYTFPIWCPGESFLAGWKKKLIEKCSN